MIRIPKQLDQRIAIVNVFNSWEGLLDIIPKDHILAIDSIDVNVFDIRYRSSNSKRLSSRHGLLKMTAEEWEE